MVYSLVCTYIIICVIRPRGVTGLIRYTRVDEDGARRTRVSIPLYRYIEGRKNVFKKKTRVNDREIKNENNETEKWNTRATEKFTTLPRGDI